MPIERDDLATRIIGHNEKCLQFYDGDRVLRAEIFLRDDNTLNITGDVTFSGGVAYVVPGTLPNHTHGSLVGDGGILRAGITGLDVADGSILYAKAMVGGMKLANDWGTLYWDHVNYRLGIGIGSGLPLGGKVHVKQGSTTGAIPVLYLDQLDISEQCIKFSSAATDRDINLFTVEVTGSPAMMWDESEDQFSLNKGLILTAGDVEIASGVGIIHADGVAAGYVLRGDGTRYVPGAIQAGDLPGLGGTPALTLGLANAVGAAATYVQTDASLAIFDAVVPGTIECDDAAAAGTAAFAARRDHTHGIVCAAPVDIGNSNGEGTAASFARSDHVHNHPAALGADLHHTEVHVINSTGPHAESGLTIGHVLRATAAAAFSFQALIAADLPASGVTPGTYGSATQVGQVTVDTYGRVTAAANVTITGAAPSAHAATHEVGGSDLVGHDSLTGFVADEHVAHTGVSITAGTGLAGGGTIAATRTLSLSFLGLEALADPGADRIVFWDDSATKLDWLSAGAGIVVTTTVLSVDHDAATNFVAAEHINHLDVTLTAGDGLTGGGDISASRTFAVNAGDGIDLVADAVTVDVTDILGTGLTEVTNNITLGTPTTLTVSTTNAVTATSHTHAITSSSNPGAAARMLASNASGYLQLVGLGIGTAAGLANRITMVDGGTIGQAAGPLLTFNDTSNVLTLTGAKFSIGTATPISFFDVSASGENTVASIVCYDDGASESRLYLRKSDTDAIGTLSQTDNADWLGMIGFQGVTSTPGWGYGVLIYAIQQGVAGATYIETDLFFQTYSATGGNANQLVLAGGTGYVGVGTIPDRLLHSEVTDAGTATIVYPLRLTHSTSGTAADLFGVGMEFELEAADGVSQVASRIATEWADASDESPLLRFNTYPAGSIGPAHWGCWSWAGVNATLRDVIVNGVGDVTRHIWIRWVAASSNGTWQESQSIDQAIGTSFTIPETGDDGDGNIWTVTIGGAGGVTIQRTTTGGTPQTLDVGFFMAWI